MVPGNPGAPTEASTYTVAENKRRRRVPPVDADCPPAPLHPQSRERSTLDGAAPLCQCSYATLCVTNDPEMIHSEQIRTNSLHVSKAESTSTLRDKVPWTSFFLKTIKMLNVILKLSSITAFLST